MNNTQVNETNSTQVNETNNQTIQQSNHTNSSNVSSIEENPNNKQINDFESSDLDSLIKEGCFIYSE